MSQHVVHANAIALYVVARLYNIYINGKLERLLESKLLAQGIDKCPLKG
jgi:hypothetical protein